MLITKTDLEIIKLVSLLHLQKDFVATILLLLERIAIILAAVSHPKPVDACADEGHEV